MADDAGGEEDPGIFVTLMSAARAKVAGGKLMHWLYYAFFTAALVMFGISAGGVILSADEDITSVETVLLDKVEFPVIWVCLNSFVSDAANFGGVSINVTADPSCGPNHATLVEGTLEEWFANGQKNGECVDITASDQNSVVSQLESYFNTSHCFLANTDKSFVSKRDATKELIVGFQQTGAVTGAVSYGMVGFYPQGGQPFKNGDLISQYFRLSFQNAVGSVGVSIDTLSDETGVQLMPSMSDEDDDPDVIYKVSADSYPAVYTEAAGINTVDVTASETYYIFYVSDFVSRKITITSPSFSEIWAGLGGALTAALAIIALAFREEVVPDSEGTGSHKVQVFRFRTLADAKNELREWAEEQANEVLNSSEVVATARDEIEQARDAAGGDGDEGEEDGGNDGESGVAMQKRGAESTL